MDSIKISKQNAKIVAHRGLSGIERENAIPAFVAAGNRSYFGIETDVHRTSDGKFVVIHDDRTGRVSTVDISVESSSFADLRKLMLTDTDGEVGRCDLRIPTLDEYVKVCARYEKVCVLELKNEFCADDIKAIVDLIEHRGYLHKVIFISFSYENLVKLRALLPDQKIQYLTGKYTEDLTERLLAHGFDLDIWYGELTKERVDHLHNNNIEINCWTVDKKEDGERLASWGVDYITSNILE